MRAAVIRAFGVAPTFAEFEEPMARDGEFAVRVTAAGLPAHGSRMGWTMGHIFAAVAELFATGAKEPFVFEVKTAPLSEAETVWDEKESGVRVVFQI